MGDVYFNNFWAMGTRCDVVLPGIKNSTADYLYSKIYDEIVRLENKLSHFMPVSDVSYINENASDQEILIDDELFDLIEKCLEFSEKTDGRFDISILPLLELWQSDQQNEIRKNPEQREIDYALEKSGYRHILLNEHKSSIAFDHPGVKIDLGGIGKGVALEKVDELLSQYDVQNAFISFGESSIMVKGNHPCGESWRVGIQHVYQPGVSIHTFELKDMSLSTSGMRSLQGSNEIEQRFHIIDPCTGHMVRDQKTISVTSSSAVEAEALSTALMTSDIDNARRILQQFPECHAIEIRYGQDKKAGISIFQ
ncbi:hypothetical protein GF337_06755 [candidate division KSB1 bacterium]|nr:hypothetical protein [candidate division KSB1 bacterium]